MEELIRQALGIARAMWGHRRIAVGVAWAVGLIAAAVVFRIPDKYEASAKVYVDTQSMLKPLMAGLAVQPNVEQQIVMLSRTLISRPNVEKLIRMSDLDLKVGSKAEQEALIDGLMKTLKIQAAQRDNLYTVSFRHEKPEQAKKVVQALVSIFVESSLGDKRKDSDSAKRFIEEQIQSYEKKLEEAEARLKEFKLRHVELQIGDTQSSADRMGEIVERLNAARLELRETVQSRDSLKRQITGEEPIFLPDAGSADATAQVSEINGRIESLNRNLDGLLQKYTEQHPDVVGTRRLIADLEAQRQAEIAARRKTTGGTAPSVRSNPVYQQLRVALGEAEARVASLEARVAEYEARHAKIKQNMKLVPQLEAEFAQLNRDYDVHKRNYEQFVSRRESANISGDLETTASVADFRVIEPPYASSKPVAPNRLALLPAALVASLLAGLAAAFVASQLRPVFLDSRSLREDTGLPLLGSVTLVVNDALRRQERKSLLRVLAALSGLFATYAAGLAYIALVSRAAA
jgi:polysaccharide chain length determinant protein (PEP-CTERM system associated)